MKGPVYVGSVQYDTEDGQTADQYAYGFNQEYLIENLVDLLKRRKNSEVLFASFIDRSEREHDITEKVRSLCIKNM